jgi:uncharacterized Tic20 family protein
MNQPDLGLKIVELRKLKGFTQERLAELCEVNTRTIQRIERGEVDPRSYTIQLIGQALAFDFEKDILPQESLLLVLLHLSVILCNMLIPLNVLIPLILWSWKKDQSSKINMQGKQVLNFQITMTLFMLAFAMFMFLILLPISSNFGLHLNPSILIVILSTIPLVIIVIFSFIQSLINAIRSISGKPVHYSLSIPFIQ